eukprot:scaffold4652_cov54-Attheya_sp.AAC.9
MKIISVISLLALAVAPSAASTFTFDSASCDKNAELSYASITASDGGSSITMGDTVTVSGTMEITEEFDTDAIVTLKGCIKVCFVYPMCETLNTGTACQMLDPTDGDCGDAGSYEFSQSQDIPDVNLVWYMSAPSIHAEISGVTDCDFKMNASSSGGAMIVGMSIVSTALLVSALLFSKQRRNVVVTQEDEKATPFVEMSHV